MTLDGYQEHAHRTAVYPPALALEYLTLGLVGEAGELANKLKKVLRGDFDDQSEAYDLMANELGDVLWYLAELANELGYSLDVIAQRNLKKLNKRMDENKIRGSGDNR